MLAYPYSPIPRRRRTFLGIVPLRDGNGGRVRHGALPVWTGRRCVPGDVILENAHWDPTLCRWVPNPPAAPTSTPATPGSPVPASFPTNELFMAPDGSQWAYSFAQGRWVFVGRPFDLSVASNPPSASTSTPPTVTSTPVSVTVAPAAPATSPYQTVIDFATKSSLISGVPNWVVGVGVLLGVKLAQNYSSGGGSRRNPARHRR